MGEAELSLWTTWLDYFATGEGRTMMARVCRARDEASAGQQFGETFDSQYAQRCSVQRGSEAWSVMKSPGFCGLTLRWITSSSWALAVASRQTHSFTSTLADASKRRGR